MPLVTRKTAFAVKQRREPQSALLEYAKFGSNPSTMASTSTIRGEANPNTTESMVEPEHNAFTADVIVNVKARDQSDIVCVLSHAVDVWERGSVH
jgi:hypothetical protein